MTNQNTARQQPSRQVGSAASAAGSGRLTEADDSQGHDGDEGGVGDGKPSREGAREAVGGHLQWGRVRGQEAAACVQGEGGRRGGGPWWRSAWRPDQLQRLHKLLLLTGTKESLIYLPTHLQAHPPTTATHLQVRQVDECGPHRPCVRHVACQLVLIQVAARRWRGLGWQWLGLEKQCSVGEAEEGQAGPGASCGSTQRPTRAGAPHPPAPCPPRTTLTAPAALGSFRVRPTRAAAALPAHYCLGAGW